MGENNASVTYLSVKKDIFNPEDKKFDCVDCNRVFTTSSDLRRHERLHFTQKSFHCSYPNCQYSAFQKANLLSHEQTHRSIESRLSHICPLCKKCVSSKSILTRHQKTCDGKTREQKSLKHQANFCSVCRKHFSTTHKLNNHKKSHTGDLQFKCEVCKKAFSSNEALVKHALIHGEKSFRCDYCEKLWTRKDHLQQHMKVHIKEQKKQNCESDKLIDGEKPLDYLCGICGKTFSHSQKEVLLQHMALHHPENSQSNVQTSFHDIVTYEECDTGKIVLATSVSNPHIIFHEAYQDNNETESQHIVIHHSEAFQDNDVDGQHVVVQHGEGDNHDQYVLQQADNSHILVYQGEQDHREILVADQSATALISLPQLAITGSGEVIVEEVEPSDEYEGNLIIVEGDRLLVDS